jgi:N-terminal or F0 domain of Talin-head FERM
MKTLNVFFLAQEYGLFLADEDPKKGVWLESARTLEYYLLRNGVCIVTYLAYQLILV